MSGKKESGHGDIYARITDRIVADLEKGVRPWVQPWNAGNATGRITRPLRHNGEPYTGMNVLLLWSEGLARGFASSIWMTFKQSIELGGHVRKGESGSTVIYASRFTKTETDEHGGEVERDIPFLKTYTVFNVEQIENLPEHFYHKPTPILDPVERIEHADRFFTNTGSIIRHGGSRAFYSPSTDHVQMPPFETFLFDFDAEIYGRHLEIALVNHIRGQEVYKGLDELIAAIGRDSRKAREALGQCGPLSDLDRTLGFFD